MCSPKLNICSSEVDMADGTALDMADGTVRTLLTRPCSLCDGQVASQERDDI